MIYICQDNDCGKKCSDNPRVDNIVGRLRHVFLIPTGNGDYRKHEVFKCPYCRGKLYSEEELC